MATTPFTINLGSAYVGLSDLTLKAYTTSLTLAGTYGGFAAVPGVSGSYFAAIALPISEGFVTVTSASASIALAQDINVQAPTVLVLPAAIVSGSQTCPNPVTHKLEINQNTTPLLIMGPYVDANGNPIVGVATELKIYSDPSNPTGSTLYTIAGAYEDTSPDAYTVQLTSASTANNTYSQTLWYCFRSASLVLEEGEFIVIPTPVY